MDKSHIGFVGIGRMGSLMTPRLLDAGYTLTIYDIVPAAMEPLIHRGAIAAESPADVACQADIVFVSVPTPDIVKEVALGERGIASGTKAKIYVDVSTTGPRMASLVSSELKKKGITAVDSPVSGGLKGARNGTLAMMVSCPREVYDEITPILEVFGKLFFVSEQAGLSQMVKLINNLLAAATLAVSSEAVVLGVKAGLDPKILIDIINASSGRSTATEDKFTRSIFPRSFDFGFTTALSLKDVRLCLQEAEELGVPMIIGPLVRQLLAITNATYGPDSDYTSMIRPLERWSGVEVRG